jgi:septal ring factor EnvC (AmiA/AmiB activator)
MADRPTNGTAKTYVAIAAAVTFVMAAGTAPWAVWSAHSGSADSHHGIKSNASDITEINKHLIRDASEKFAALDSRLQGLDVQIRSIDKEQAVMGADLKTLLTRIPP